METPLWTRMHLDNAIELAETIEMERPSPKVLLVDDDALFCRSFRRAAKHLDLDLTVCKTIGEVTKLGTEKTFDVAVLDYFFGEMTAFQLADLLESDVPIVLVSNTAARKLSGDSWPAGITRFVPKSLGIDAILAEAVRTARQTRPKETAPTPPTAAEPRTSPARVQWWLPFVAALLTVLCLGLLFAVLSPRQPQDKIWRWDKAPLEPTHLFSSVSIEEKEAA